MLRRQDFVCCRCFRWKGEDSDKPLKKESFLGILGSLYDTFEIHSNTMKPDGVSLKQAKENVTKIDNYVKETVSKVRERYQLSETSAAMVHRELYQRCVFALKGWTGYTGNVTGVNP